MTQKQHPGRDGERIDTYFDTPAAGPAFFTADAGVPGLEPRRSNGSAA